MEKKKYLFPDFTVAYNGNCEVIVMSGTGYDSDENDTLLEGGWTL